MKKYTTLFSISTGLAVMGLTLGDASATPFDQNVTPNVIFGSGNANGSFTVDQGGGVELGLRGKIRHGLTTGAPENTFNSNGDGTYSFAAGVPFGQSSPTGVWSFEWSINSDFAGTSGKQLADFTYELWIDSDQSQGVSFSMFDPINPSSNPSGYWDHSIGTNSTGNGAGTEATDIGTYSSLISHNNVAQNSWKANWFLTGFDPTADGTYDFELLAFDGTTQVAGTSMQVIVGAGGAAVPDGGSMAGLFGISVLGLVGFRRFIAIHA